MEPYKETSFNENKATCKMQNCPFIFINYYRLLIAVSICCYLIKHWAMQKNLLPFHDTNNKLIKFLC